jgi:hypothetical protein
VAVGDVNGDGKPDVIVANDSLDGNEGSVNVFLGKGDGTIQGGDTWLSGGQYATSVVVADVNGDGKPDLLVTVACGTCFTGSVGVLLNVSSGSTATTTAIASSSNPSVFGQPVTFTATVTGQGSVTPTGTVTFYNSTATLGTGTLNGSGVATYTTSSLAAGQYLMTATYGGDASNFGSSSSVLTQVVNAASFSVTPNPTSATVMAGQSATFTVTVTPQGLFNSPISFSCTGLPALAACTFKPASVTPNSSPVTSTLIITTTAQNASLANPFRRGSNPLYAMWLVLPAMLLGTAGMAAPKSRKLLSYCLAFLLVGGCLLQVACSSGSNGSSGGGGTPAGTYTITVIGAAGSTQYMTTVKTTVQ